MIWKLLVGFALSAFFLWLAFRDANLPQVWAAILTADLRWIIPMIAVTLVSFVLRAWRWQYLLSGESVRLGPLFRSTMIGFMGNNVLPARLGELMRVYAIGNSSGISRSSALASIVLERIFDMGTLLILFVIVLATGRLPEEVRSWGGYLLAIAAIAFLGVFVFWIRRDFILGLVRRFAPARVRDRLLQITENFHTGLEAMGRRGALLKAFLLSLLIWATLIAVVDAGFRALGLGLPYDAGVIVLVVMAIGTMIPSAPGFLGTLQYAGTLALTQYDIDRSVALSFTLVYHASQWFPVTAIGFYYFLRQHLSWSAVGRDPARPDPARPIPEGRAAAPTNADRGSAE